MTDARRSPLQLAALASAAVKGLDPVSVETVHGEDERCDVAYVQDTRQRRWTIRVPRSVADAAQMEAAAVLLPHLDHRLSFAVPTEAGSIPLRDNGRAMVFPQVEGRNLDFSRLPGGPGLAAALGRALAEIHNLDSRLYDEAGVPTYDAEACRTRHLAEVDRAASTGRVPTRLLGRWERALERVSCWRFAGVPVHGRLSGELVLADFDADDDAATGRIVAVTGWDQARVGDPAEDFATLRAQASDEAFDTVLEAYAAARRERPDRAIEVRARLLGELHMVRELVLASAADDERAVASAARALRQLDDEVQDDELDPELPPVTTPGLPLDRTQVIASDQGAPEEDGDQATGGEPVDGAVIEGRVVDDASVEPEVGGSVVVGEDSVSVHPDEADEYVIDTTTHTTTPVVDRRDQD